MRGHAADARVPLWRLHEPRVVVEPPVMATWDKMYAAEDRKRRREAADTALRARHDMFDLQAQDKTPKSARHHWTVVGEGSRTANENYAIGWERIFPTCRPDARGSLPPGPARPGVGAAG